MADSTIQQIPDDRLSIYSIGHSNQPLERFLQLLAQHNIQVLIDVRSAPYSHYVPHFNRPELEDAVERRKIGYRYMGDTLGGRPEGDEYYDSEGYVLYGRVAEADFFHKGLERLIDEAATCCAAIMCSEEDPTNCHRRLLLARVLADQGIDVYHIRGDGRIETEEALDGRKPEQQPSLWGTLSLEDQEEETAEWKSIRPVSRRGPPKNSSALYDAPEFDV